MASISSLLNLSGEVSVPAQTFTPATGAFHRTPSDADDYLVLIAQGADPQNGIFPVKVDSRHGDFAIQTGSKQILFVGFWFDGTFVMDGTDILFWQCRGSFTGVQRNSTVSNPNGYVHFTDNYPYNSPDFLQCRGSTRLGWYGGEVYDCGDYVDIMRAINAKFIGTHFHDSYDNYNAPDPPGPPAYPGGPLFPNGSWHVDCPDSNVNSSTSRVTSWLLDQCFLDLGRHGGGPQMQATQNDIFATIRDTWIKSSSDVGVDMSGANGHISDLTLQGDVRIWDDTAAIVRRGNTAVHGTFSTVVPTGLDPATRWRNANPFGSYRTHPDLAHIFGTTPPQVPGAPIIGTATPGNAIAVARWSAPSSSGNTPIDQYRITPTPAAPVVTTGPTARQATVTGLTNGTPYTFKVAARNGAGYGPDSAASNSVTPFVPVSAPDAPSILGFSAGDSAVGLLWTRPADHGAPIDLYEVLCTSLSPPSTVTQVFSGNPSGGTVTGLVNGRTYTAKVRAHNSVGYGPFSPNSGSFTPAGVAPPVTNFDAVGIMPL